MLNIAFGAQKVRLWKEEPPRPMARAQGLNFAVVAEQLKPAVVNIQHYTGDERTATRLSRASASTAIR
jgi:hypothetical protein